MSKETDNVENLEEQRQKELEQRIAAAQQRAQALSALMLGERILIDADTEVMAVPNGWIFTQRHKAGITSTYVTQPPAPPGVVQKEPAIII